MVIQSTVPTDNRNGTGVRPKVASKATQDNDVEVIKKKGRIYKVDCVKTRRSLAYGMKLSLEK